MDRDTVRAIAEIGDRVDERVARLEAASVDHRRETAAGPLMVEHRLEAVEDQLGAVEQRLGDFGDRFAGMDARIRRTEVMIESMRDDIRLIAARMASLSMRLDARGGSR